MTGNDSLSTGSRQGEAVAARSNALAVSEGQAMRPCYLFPKRFVWEVIWSALWGRRRSAAADAERALASLRRAPRVEGEEWIPPDGSFVIVGNHYQRPGLWVGWGVLAIVAAIARRRPDLRDAVYVFVIGGWRGGRVGRIPVPDAGTRWAFRRAAEVYDLVLMPPDERQVAARARAVREAVRLLKGQAEQCPSRALFVAPEGDVSVELVEARRGVGAFMLLLSKAGIPLLPVGMYEQGDVLNVRFGQPFVLKGERLKDRDERDRLARKALMVRIGCLLPRELWGFYAAEISQNGEA